MCTEGGPGASSDEILMAAYQAGSREAFARLFERHGGSVYGFLVRRISDRSLVEDLFQEIFLRLHRSRRTYDGRRPFRAWLFGIVHNLVVDALRERGRRPRMESIEPGAGRRAENSPRSLATDDSAEDRAAVRERTSALASALRALPADESTALVLARLEGLSYDDIGHIIGRSPTATKQLAYRALQRIRARMAAAGHGDDA